MEDTTIVDLISSEDSSGISDAIKQLLMAKAAEKIEGLRPGVVHQMFDLESEE